MTPPSRAMLGWIGVDLDGALARHDVAPRAGEIGDPIRPMVDRILMWLRQGQDVRIFTARVAPFPAHDHLGRPRDQEAERAAIEVWCELHIGRKLPVTHEIDSGCRVLWAAKCVQVEKNTGRIAVAPHLDGTLDLVAHLYRQRNFSARTFGPGARTQGVLDHIRKELVEIEREPRDLEEWIDLILLACDGAWRAGHEPEAIALMLDAKLTKNEARKWPDWRTAPDGKAIEHIRDGEAA